MAHNLNKVLYRYQKLKGRQAMRDRAASGDINRVAWVVCKSGMTPPSLEQMAIRRYQHPWNMQHNPNPRKESRAATLTNSEQDWLDGAAAELDQTLDRLAKASPVLRRRLLRLWRGRR